MTQTEPPRLRSVDPSIPRDLETIVLKAMAREPGDRYRTAGDAGRGPEEVPVRSTHPGAAQHDNRAGLAVVPPKLSGGLAPGTPGSAADRAGRGINSGGIPVQSDGRCRTLGQDRRDRGTRDYAAVCPQGDREGRELQRQLYANLIGRAYGEWQSNHLAVAEGLLDECPREMRGLEWNYVKRLCHLEKWIYTGHERNVWCVAVSPDGSRIASGSGLSIHAFKAGMGRLAVNDAATGRELFAHDGLTGGVHGVAFSPDGRRLATAAGLLSPEHEGGPALWDAASGKRLWSRIEKQTQMICVQFSPDGSRIAVGTGRLQSHRGRCPSLLHYLGRRQRQEDQNDPGTQRRCPRGMFVLNGTASHWPTSRRLTSSTLPMTALCGDSGITLLLFTAWPSALMGRGWRPAAHSHHSLGPGVGEDRDELAGPFRS